MNKATEADAIVSFYKVSGLMCHARVLLRQFQNRIRKDITYCLLKRMAPSTEQFYLQMKTKPPWKICFVTQRVLSMINNYLTNIKRAFKNL